MIEVTEVDLEKKLMENFNGYILKLTELEDSGMPVAI